MFVSKIVLLLLCVSVDARHVNEQNFDLDVSAAEPRPIFIETGPSAEALPLVYSVDSTNGPLTDASEKVEKVLRPAIAFSYYQKGDDDKEEEASESKHEDQNLEDIDYLKQVEADDKKEAAGKEERKELDAGEQIAESTHHGGHKHGGGGGGGGHGGKFEKGGGKDHHAHHHGEHGEKGDKGYKGHHHHEKGQKGHHDKEGHDKHYDEEGGHKKDHHHKDGYHGEHHKGYNGKKGSKYEESGEHDKGHSTKGSHSIHKKDEFEKKTEFFEEENEGGESEKHGGFSHKGGYKKGGHHKGGHKKGGHHEDHYGKKGESSKGGHHKDEKGHQEKGGHEEHHKHDSKYGKKEGDSSGKKWAYKKGSGHGGGGGGGGGGHGHGAHSHQSYAVQEPPKKEIVAEAIPIKTYEIAPISSYVLPLEGESEIEETADPEVTRKTASENKEYVDDEKGEPSEHVRAVAKKDSKLKKRRPTPTDDFEVNSPFSDLTTKESMAAKPLREFEPSVSTTASPIELLIRKELKKNRPTDSDLEQESEETQNTTVKPKKLNKKRRLKKRKMQKDATAEANYRPSRAVPKCLQGHKKEIQVSDESTNSFVIVAADDLY